ncbi:MAG: phenylalanine--tRNA ligase subunit alpha [Patescibacteria group bacterium]
MKQDGRGHLHLLTQAERRARAIFQQLGFATVGGPEVETEYYNFDALNISADHPARDLWDTFWLEPRSASRLLRTHTSPVQIRYLENHPPPVRIIAPGRVFRYEATDATHNYQFHQLEGLVVDRQINLAQLKGVVEEFLRQFFNLADLATRFRPSYFPFVEPGVEVDILWRDKFVEVMGAGLVHPTVLDGVGLDPEVWSGFAFGLGLDRLTMIRHGVDDVRYFYDGHIGFLQQF